MAILQNINCAFDYVSGTVFLIGIILYIYYLVIYYQEYDDPENNYKKNKSEVIWVWFMFILLILGLISVSYCLR